MKDTFFCLYKIGSSLSLKDTPRKSTYERLAAICSQ